MFIALKVTKPGDPKHCFMQCSGISDKTSITSEIMVNAAGEYSPPMIIYNRTRRPKQSEDIIVTDKNGNKIEYAIGLSDNGWITFKLLYEYLTNTFHNWLDKMKIQGL